MFRRVEQAALAQVFPIIKREDEKRVTEQAWDNLKLVVLQFRLEQFVPEPFGDTRKAKAIDFVAVLAVPKNRGLRASTEKQSETSEVRVADF